MNLKIWSPSTLYNFTNNISEGFLSIGVTLNDLKPFHAGLAQIHGSPNSNEEDLKIIQEAVKASFPTVFLMHRPDEILHHSNLISLLSHSSSQSFILFGDLMFQIPFWSKREKNCNIIPHPYTDLALPQGKDKITIGSFTTWGEMRNLDHYLGLIEKLKHNHSFEFKIGGPGLNKTNLPPHVKFSDDFFVPHFNVQLYNLKGMKRKGESSGSLHRGISIPVIFEANGMERIENILSVKINANDDLSIIDFDGAAEEIQSIAQENLDSFLKHNATHASRNLPSIFAKSVIKCFKGMDQ